MKRLLLIGLLAACGKSNDVATLHEEAVTQAAFYQPKVEAADKRVQAIFKRGTTIPANLPGIEEVGKRLTEARDTIIQLRGIVGKGPDGKSAVEKSADIAAKDNKVAELEKLVDDTEETLDTGLRVINDDLNSVESWIALYDQGINKQTNETAPNPTNGQTPGTPPEGTTAAPTTQNQTGQPPAAVQQPEPTKAPQPKTDPAKQPKTEPAKPAQPAQPKK